MSSTDTWMSYHVYWQTKHLMIVDCLRNVGDRYWEIPFRFRKWFMSSLTSWFALNSSHLITSACGRPLCHNDYRQLLPSSTVSATIHQTFWIFLTLSLNPPRHEHSWNSTFVKCNSFTQLRSEPWISSKSWGRKSVGVTLWFEQARRLPIFV